MGSAASAPPGAVESGIIVAAPPSDWADLPIDLLNNVAKQLADITSYIRFRAVCKAWSSALAGRRPDTQLPWLLQQWRTKEQRISFFSIGDSQTYTVPLPARLANAASKTICGSCNGWLAIEDTDELTVSLLNPLTGALVELPKSANLINSKKQEKVILYEGGKQTEYSIMSVMVLAIAMSADPASGRDCAIVIVSLWNWGLVSIRVGDDGWKSMDGGAKYHDVIYRGGRFYAVDHSCGVTVFDGAGLNKVAVVPRPTSRCDHSVFWRFVEVSGELLLLRRVHQKDPINNAYMHPPKFSTTRFDIYRLRLEGHEMSLEAVTDLGDNVLFYGFSNGLAFPAAEFPGGKPNAVYCAEVYVSRELEQGLVICYAEPEVFDMASAAVEPLPEGAQFDRWMRCFSTWFIPTLQ